MADFAIRFFISNLFISAVIGMLLAVKYVLKKKLTSRTQYNLWFLLLGLLAVPFVPIRQIRFLSLFSWINDFQSTSISPIKTVIGKTGVSPYAAASDWMNDFGISISQKAPSGIGYLLFVLWLAGILGMIVLTARSVIRFHALKKSSLPLQNPDVHRLYHDCLKEMNITKNIPIYSTAFLKSPVIGGFFKPCIYLPIHLISDHNARDIRYMLLHELSHYRHKDSLVNYFMNAACVLYWFNPFVWYALNEMKNDREIACDTSVLKMLEADAYKDYGNTLINFAEKISLMSFPFATGMSGSMAQMQKRILNIAGYRKASFRKTLYGLLAYALIAVFLSGFIPVLSIRAADHSRYSFHEHGKNIAYLDLNALFGENDGSFVLYDAEKDTWQIYNKECAMTRTAPVSTYKIYSALFALEAGIISPDQSLITWDGQHYDYDLWNSDQTLSSAMQHSVTWYFQAIDEQAGFPAIRDYIQEIGYGSQTVAGDLSTYWADSSLSISPIEQVEMLKKLYDNEFGFTPENIDAVKDSIHLYVSGNGDVYGKTGTGEVNGRNTLGWFVGYIEKSGNTYFFATNIQNDELATGSIAADLTFSILADLHIWN